MDPCLCVEGRFRGGYGRWVAAISLVTCSSEGKTICVHIRILSELVSTMWHFVLSDVSLSIRCRLHLLSTSLLVFCGRSAL